MTAGILGDLLIGDPHGIPHPVRAIGHLITALEKRLYPSSETVLQRSGKNSSLSSVDRADVAAQSSGKSRNHNGVDRTDAAAQCSGKNSSLSSVKEKDRTNATEQYSGKNSSHSSVKDRTDAAAQSSGKSRSHNGVMDRTDAAALCRSMKRRGGILWGLVVLTTAACTALVLALAYRIHLYAGAAVEAVLTCYLLAAGSLYRESMEVGSALQKEGMEAARKSLSMIVGRDTDTLDESGILCAAVETVAENTSDGVIAPLLAAALGGPVLGWIYKAVNTMDSMLGYHNNRYEYFGRVAARADDLFNYIPSRISAVLMIVASCLTGLFSKRFSGRNALRIWRRDRRNHLSPNSAQTESVCAGALGLKLGGTHTYNGIPVEKPSIGDHEREPEHADIARANLLMLVTEALAAAGVLAIWIFIITRSV